MLLKLVARLESLKSDRGEGPIPHLIMVTLMAIGAAAVAAGIMAVTQGWLDDIPTR